MKEDKKFLNKIETALKKERDLVEKELSRFARRDKRPKGDWDTQFPKSDSEAGEEALLEDKARGIEEYISLLPVEFILEKKLRDIEEALKKIKGENYGICEGCKKEIGEDRLLVIPETKLCFECEKRERRKIL